MWPRITKTSMRLRTISALDRAAEGARVTIRAQARSPPSRSRCSGPLVTIGVALGRVRRRSATASTRSGARGDRAGARARPEVRRHRHERLADGVRLRRRAQPDDVRHLGRSRRADAARARARRTLTAPRERALLAELGGAYDDVHGARRAGLGGAAGRPSRGHEADPARARARALRDDGARRRRARRRAGARRRGRGGAGSTTRATTRSGELVAVAIGAGVVIVLLLITVQDVVRLALERRDERA